MIKSVLSIEWLKIRKLVSVKIILGIYILIVPLWLYFLSQLLQFNKQETASFLPDANVFFSFPLIWKMCTYCASYFNVLLGVIVVIMTASDFSSKTFRQNVIEGMSREQYIIGRFMSILGLSVVVTLITTSVALIFGLIYSASYDLYAYSHFIVTYFLQTLCYFSFALFLTVLLRQPALSIIIFILSFLVETIIGIFLPPKMYLYFPLNVFSKLTQMPFTGVQIRMHEAETGIDIPTLSLTEVVIFSIAFMLIFYFVSIFVLRKRNI